MSSSSSSKKIERKVLLVLPLLFALWLLTDDESSTTTVTEDNNTLTTDGITPPKRRVVHHHHHHLAALTALRRHPPSLRVFRALSELSLVLFCTALSLWVWECTVGTDIVGMLLFRRPEEEEDDNTVGGGSRTRRGTYELVSLEDGTNVDGGGDDDDGDGGGGGNNNEHWDENVVGNIPVSACDADGCDSDGSASGSTTTEEEPTIVHKNTTEETTTTTMLPMPPQPPTSTEVVGAALDLLLLTLVTLFFFTLSSTEGGRYIDDYVDESNVMMRTTFARIAAPIFPLVLFFMATMMVVVPWKKRKGFWLVVSLTTGAPFHDVTFRDGFIGDILTSTVRPLQDVTFTIFYLFAGLQGWWSKSYGIDDAAVPVERSWLLHTIVLPGCMISPLWWRFLQNLRQCYETKQRWPYLGNAFKYFIAAEVALFGVFDPSKKQTMTWIVCFFLATLYQVWWDVFMDWELLILDDHGSNKSWMGGSSYLPPFSLRPNRVYRYRAVYWTIFVINFLLRFCWTLSFIPPRYLNRSGMLLNTFSNDFETFVGPAIASAEIIRRTLWGLIRLELEALKISGNEVAAAATTTTSSTMAFSSSQGLPSPGNNNSNNYEIAKFDTSSSPDGRRSHHYDLTPMSIEGTTTTEGHQSKFVSLVPPMLRSSPNNTMLMMIQSDMSTSSDMQILAELCLWATAFTSLGIMAAAHRQVM